MRVLLLLMICLALSLYQTESFTIKKRNLFVDRISSQNFNYQHDYLHFSEDGQQMRMHDNTDESLKILTLDSVYTSSKAVYKTIEGRYVGVVLLDKSIYMTQSSDSIMTTDFKILYFFGVQENYLL